MIRSLAGRFWGAATRAQNVIEECIEEGTRAAIVSLHALTLDVSEDEIGQIQFQVYLLASSAVTGVDPRPSQSRPLAKPSTPDAAHPAPSSEPDELANPPQASGAAASPDATSTASAPPSDDPNNNRRSDEDEEAVHDEGALNNTDDHNLKEFPDDYCKSNPPKDQFTSQPKGEPEGQPEGQPEDQSKNQFKGQPEGQLNGLRLGEFARQPLTLPFGDLGAETTAPPESQPEGQTKGQPKGLPKGLPEGPPKDLPESLRQPTGTVTSWELTASSKKEVDFKGMLGIKDPPANETASPKKKAETDPPGEDISVEDDLMGKLEIKGPPVLLSPDSVLLLPESPNDDKDNTNKGTDLSSHFTNEHSSNPAESGLSTPKVLEMTAMAESLIPRHGLLVPRNPKSDDDCNEGAPGSVGTHSLLSLSAVTK